MGVAAEATVEAPKYWMRDGDEWCARVDGRRGAGRSRICPVCHVSYHEAEAFARFAGKRLPTEQEWEVAAGWDRRAKSHARRFRGATSAADAGARERRPTVVRRRAARRVRATMVAARLLRHDRRRVGVDVERLSRDIPGYETFPYPEYSEVFFGSEYKVLRGGSWATRPGAIRNSFRNWDYPIRRQIFSGFGARAMTSATGSSRRRAARRDAARRKRQMLAEVRDGMSRTPRELPPKYFYDERGSHLFEEITRLPEYYLTRAEREILLDARAARSWRITGRARSSSSALAARRRREFSSPRCRRAARDVTYVPVDVSEEFLQQTRDALAARIPRCAWSRSSPTSARRSTFRRRSPSRCCSPSSAARSAISTGPAPCRCSAACARRCAPSDRFLLGTDLRKDPATIEAAYNDSAGRDGGIQPQHAARAERRARRRLRSGAISPTERSTTTERIASRCSCDSIGAQTRPHSRARAVDFRRRREIRTELSHKYDRGAVDVLADAARLRVTHWFTDR